MLDINKLIGKRFNNLIVLADAEWANRKGRMIRCQCNCGNAIDINLKSLIVDGYKPCGRRTNKYLCGMTCRKDLLNKRFGRLLVIAEADRYNKLVRWLCKCDCGKLQIIVANSLICGSTKSCGCLKKDILKVNGFKSRGINHHAYRHGKYCGEGVIERLEFREQIRKRDNNVCQKCGQTQKQELDKYCNQLSVHHINLDHYDDRLKNCTTLCKKCHREIHQDETNKQRDNWSEEVLLEYSES